MHSHDTLHVALQNGVLLLASCAAWRVGNALAVITFFNPDEYWQSLEPAHRLAFGYGHLTWEWVAGLRL